MQLNVRFLFFFFFFSMCMFAVISQPLPNNNSNLNYTNIYFENNFIQNAIRYELVLSKDSTFKSKVNFVLLKSKLPAFWVNNLNWNSVYYWQIKAFDSKSKLLNSSDRYKFSIIKPGIIDFDSLKIDVKKNKIEKTNKGFICIDNTKSIIDRSGKMVWTTPEIPNLLNINSMTKDLKVTNQNSITFLTDSIPIEISLKGDVIWKAPYQFVLNGDTISYHHDFKKLNDDCYMVLGNKFVYRKVLGNFPDEIIKAEQNLKMIDGILYKRVEVGVILEFNKKRDLVWFWDANEYLKDEDLNFRKQANGFPNLSSYMNAFSVSSDGTKIYAGFRDLNRIIKIDKKSKLVENSYGDKFPSGEANQANGLFKNQHDALITNNNTLLLINNNDPNLSKPSSLIEIDERTIKDDNSILWKFDFDFDKLTNGKSVNGGNVIPFENCNFLVCEGYLNRLFEVTLNKEIVWDAFIYVKLKKDKEWKPSPQYRCNWVKQLDQHHFLLKQISTPYVKDVYINLDLEIFNTGNIDDKYVVEILSMKSDIPFYTYNTKSINVNLSQIQTLKIPMTRRGLNQIRVRVSAKLDKTSTKGMIFTVN